jgi:hypothetical protein
MNKDDQAKDLDEVLRDVRPGEVADYRDYIRLRQIQGEKPLSASERKRYVRVRTRLIKVGLVRPINPERLRAHAREIFASMAWYRRWWMVAKFRYAMFKTWLRALRHR